MDKEELKKKAREFLKENVVAVIATSSKDGVPEAATIYYVVDDDLNFYIQTHSDSRKEENIRINPHVALVIGTENHPVTVQVQGEISSLQNGEEFTLRSQQLEQASHQGGFPPPIEGIKGSGWIIYKITPKWLRWLDLREPSEERRSPIVLIP